MSKTLFTKVDYTLNSLVMYIKIGDIGLPDIQRPFVWKNAKVRDLFDSMYKGYPIGHLLFWKTEHKSSKRTIGDHEKQKPPCLVIVDGQQRLTSLYAVIQRIPVLRSNFKTELISIAFNPLDERFEVADAAIRRDRAFIPDISILWEDGVKVTRVITDYVNGLKTVRDVTEDEDSLIEEHILKLQGLLSYPFTALELFSEISEEDVSDVFVRVNSKGTPLNQSDFILTLMSVFWDQGRSQLEKFCQESRLPSKGNASPFNYFIEPLPAQLLRVTVGLAFRRARLQYVYSILRGKDLSTGKFSDEQRIKQFEMLSEAQHIVLNLQNWQNFINCLRQAGFRNAKMISSQNNLLYSYVYYLIGKTEYQVPEQELRKTIARWFFMSSVTGRYTGSPETAMEADLARFRDIKTGEGFIRTLNRICEITLTTDYWKVTLPNDLATSSPTSPSLYAYYAALILLEAKGLFSKIKISDLLDPSANANRNALERHHLFPKEYLMKKGISTTRETNQIANYALVEWADNSNISDKPPAIYLPNMKKMFSKSELEKMYYHHALPVKWEEMEYQDFLEQRRELIAKVIYDGYTLLIGNDIERAEADDIFDLYQEVYNGESEVVEFKASLRTNLHTSNKDPRMEFAVLKTMAGFMNSNGGTLVIGVSDDGSPLGVEIDGFENEDKMNLHLLNIAKSRLDVVALEYMHVHFDDLEDCRVMVIRCSKAHKPVFLKDEQTERFYVRTGPASTELTPSQTQDYIKRRYA